MAVKPILVVYYREDFMRNFSALGLPPDHNQLSQQLEKKFSDYHVLLVPTINDEIKEGITLQVFSDKDFGTTNYRELKTLIERELSAVTH